MNLILKDSVIIALVGIMVGCTADNGSIEQQAKVETKKVVTPVGKPSAPITMDYAISKQNLMPGDEFSIQLNFQSQVKSSISVKTNSPDKLTLLNAQTNWQSNMTKSGDRETLPALKLIAPDSGTHYIRLMASVEQDGKVLSKPFVIPVIVGDGAIQLTPVGEVIIDENGQKVLVQKGDSN